MTLVEKLFNCFKDCEIYIKDVTDAIRGLKDELKGKSPWQAFVSDLEKGIEVVRQIVLAV